MIKTLGQLAVSLDVLEKIKNLTLVHHSSFSAT
jgi:hypothetical protein